MKSRGGIVVIINDSVIEATRRGKSQIHAPKQISINGNKSKPIIIEGSRAKK